MSRVEERSSENWRGVRIGLRVFVAGSWEGKMEMWRGLFCGWEGYRSVLTDCSFEERGVSFCRAYIPAYDA